MNFQKGYRPQEVNFSGQALILEDLCGRQRERMEKGMPSLLWLPVSSRPPTGSSWVAGQVGKSEGVTGVVNRLDCQGRILTGDPTFREVFHSRFHTIYQFS